MTEHQTTETDAAGLHDRLAELEAGGWRIVRLNRLPAQLGYRITAERQRPAPEPERSIRAPYRDD